MKWRIVAVGKPALRFAREGIAEYEKRLRRHALCEIRSVRSGGGRAAEGVRLLEASEGCYRIVLDERGELPDTMEFLGKVDALERDGRVKTVAVLIGGADGHAAATREAVDWVMGLGRLTLQHEMALLLFLEQVYRVYTLKGGGPYHR